MKSGLFTALFAAIMVVFGCAPDNPNLSSVDDVTPEIGVSQQALTWQGEVIEKDDNGTGLTASYMWTFDTQEGNVCGWTGTPDYIVHYNRSGAYANKAKLRLDPEAFGAGCLMNTSFGKLSARVYDDNHVWVCAGRTRVDGCGGPSIFTNLKLWQVP